MSILDCFAIVSIVNYTFRLTPCKKIQKTDLDPELGSLNRPFFHPLREGIVYRKILVTQEVYINSY